MCLLSCLQCIPPPQLSKDLLSENREGNVDLWIFGSHRLDLARCRTAGFTRLSAEPHCTKRGTVHGDPHFLQCRQVKCDGVGNRPTATCCTWTPQYWIRTSFKVSGSPSKVRLFDLWPELWLRSHSGEIIKAAEKEGSCVRTGIKCKGGDKKGVGGEHAP